MMRGVLLFVLIPAVLALPYVGVNEAGADFGTNGPFGGGTFPGTPGSTYAYPNTGSIDYFVSKGMNLIRLPFMWERIQPTLNTALDSGELGRLTTTVNYITQTKGINVLLDVHNYCRYTLAGTAYLLGSAQLPQSALIDLWTRLATQFASNNKVFFGLMNEPHDIDTNLWAAAANATIQAIRNVAKANNLITVPGNAYTGAHSWTQTYYGVANSVALTGITDPANNFVFEIHQYLDSDFSGTHPTCVSTTVGSTQLAAFTAWARQNHFKALLGEFAGGPNDATCNAAVQDMLTYMGNNADVYVGWTWWAAGPLWGTYMFSLEPGTTAPVDKPQMAVLLPFIANTTNGHATTILPTTAQQQPTSQQTPPVTTKLPTTAQQQPTTAQQQPTTAQQQPTSQQTPPATTSQGTSVSTLINVIWTLTCQSGGTGFGYSWSATQPPNGEAFKPDGKNPGAGVPCDEYFETSYYFVDLNGNQVILPNEINGIYNVLKSQVTNGIATVVLTPEDPNWGNGYVTVSGATVNGQPFVFSCNNGVPNLRIKTNYLLTATNDGGNPNYVRRLDTLFDTGNGGTGVIITPPANPPSSFQVGTSTCPNNQQATSIPFPAYTGILVSQQATVPNNPTSAVNSPTSAVNSPTSAVNNPTSAVNNPTSAVNNPTSNNNYETSNNNNPTSAENNPTSAENNQTSEVNIPTFKIPDFTFANPIVVGGGNTVATFSVILLIAIAALLV